MDMLNNSLEQFSAKLASAAPTPGGGGAAALAGALAVALGNMVGSLTVGKKKYADVEDRIKELNAASEELRAKLLAQMDEDASLPRWTRTRKRSSPSLKLTASRRTTRPGTRSWKSAFTMPQNRP